MASPTVSINLCCYNSEKYLRETLESVVAQTYKDWELVIINDGSSDSTEKIIGEYMGRGFPIIYHYQENKGLGYSRNEALRRSSGEFIAFIDHDDIWMPGKLEKQLQLFGDPKIGLVYSDTIFFDKDGDIRLLYGGRGYPTGSCFRQMLSRYCLSMETVIIRHSVLDSMEEWFDERFNMIEEADFFRRIALKWKVEAVREPLSKWRIHGQSLTWQKPFLFAEETDLMIDKYCRTIPNFERDFTSEIKQVKTNLDLERAKQDIQSRNLRNARARLKKHLLSDSRATAIFVLSYFPSVFDKFNVRPW